MNILRLTIGCLLALNCCLPRPALGNEFVDRPLVLWSTEIHEDRLNVIRYLADVYGALTNGTRVQVTSVNDNNLVQRFTEARERGREPDIISTGSELIVALGERGVLDTKSAAEFIDTLGRNRFHAGALRQMSRGTRAGDYGIPYHGWVQGIWYRADWFREAGLKPPDTWKRILAAAQRFHDPDKGIYGILVGTDDDHYSEQIFTQLARSNAASMFAPDGSLTFDSKRMAETLRFYVQLAHLGPPGPQYWRGRDFYLQGKLAMFFYSSFIMDDLALPCIAADSLTGGNFPQLAGASFDPELVRNTGMASLIHHRRTAGYGMVNGFALPRNTPERTREAMDFLTFLYEPPQYVEWMHMAPGGMLPALRDIASSDQFLRDPLGVFYRYGRAKIKDIQAGLERVDTFSMVDGRRHPLASLFYAERIIPEMVHDAVFHGVSPEEAVARAAARMRLTADEAAKRPVGVQ